MHERVDSQWALAISWPRGAIPVKGHTLQGINDARARRRYQRRPDQFSKLEGRVI